MFGLKLVRGDLHAELIRQVQAAKLAHTMDPNGFIVVASDDDTGALEDLAFEIATRTVGAHSRRHVFHSGGSAEYCQQERSINQTRGVPFVEYETISDLSAACHPNAPPVQHSYRLVVRRESSLPKGQRPWDRT